MRDVKAGSFGKGATFFLVFLWLLQPSGAIAEEKSVSPQNEIVSPILKYLIGPEDVLEISVWKNADLSREVVVRPDGNITIPLIGDVMAAGRTPTQLRDAIVEKLKGYQENAVVSVIVIDVLSYNIFILGEVPAPGVYTLKKRTRLLQAIAMAGGFNQFASKNKILIIREKPGSPENQEKIKVRFSDIISKSKSGVNLILRPGDTIYVP